MTDIRDDDAAMPPRDDELGRALRALPVPEHSPDFFAQLEAAITVESASSGPSAAVTSISDVRRRRAWRRQTLRLAVVGAAAGVIGVAVSVNLDSPADPRREAPPGRAVALPSAMTVARTMQAALAQVESLRGEIVFRNPEGEVRARFVVTEQGDFRQSGLTRQEEFAYDAERGVERSYYVDPTGPDFGGERTGLAPGRPDPGPVNWILRRELGSTVRAVLAEDSELTVAEETYDGRDAWVLEMDVEENKLGETGDHVAVTVDQATGYPVRVLESRRGAFFREVRLERLVTDAPVDRAEFALEFPPGVEVSRFDEGWRRHDSLDSVAGAVGYAPLVPRPDALPDGYELRQISTAERGHGTGVEGLNPVTRSAVSLSFHRGLDQILVTTRLRGSIVEGREPGIAPGQCRECLGESSWSDPLASGEGFEDDPEELSVSGGALAGSPAQLLIGPHTVPHVWALGDELVVTVSGDATRAELVAILDSLAPHAG